MIAKKRKGKKLFVLDTNVLMHDPSSLFRFQEHDVFIPDRVLEELDNNKKGTTEVNRNARQAMRYIGGLMSTPNENSDEGFKLVSKEGRIATGRLFFQTEEDTQSLGKEGEFKKADNEILGVTKYLAKKHEGREVVLVSKDINIRIKAGARKILNEDYSSDEVIEDSDVVYSGLRHHSESEFEALFQGAVPSDAGSQQVFDIAPHRGHDLLVNEVVVDPEEKNAYIVEEGESGNLRLCSVYDQRKARSSTVWGIKAKSLEQSVALRFLMDPKIHLVSLMGQAGTGKTLITLAAALEQVFEKKEYHEIIVTRATVPIGDEIGFLPGSEEEKMLPWMGAIMDNLEYLRSYSEKKVPRGKGASKDLPYSPHEVDDFIMSRIKMRSLNYMRGRTFIRRFVILDESQNLTPKQMKTLVTRAGHGTKIVCLGNIAQIDTPYLTESSSGLTHLVSAFKGWSGYGHVTLARGERSALSAHAVKVL